MILYQIFRQKLDFFSQWTFGLVTLIVPFELFTENEKFIRSLENPLGQRGHRQKLLSENP